MGTIASSAGLLCFYFPFCFIWRGQLKVLLMTRSMILAGGGGEELPNKSGGGARRTFQGLKLAKIRVVVPLRVLKSKMITARVIVVPFRVLSRKMIYDNAFKNLYRQKVFDGSSLSLFFKKIVILSVNVLLQNWYLSGVKMNWVHTHKTRFWYL